MHEVDDAVARDPMVRIQAELGSEPAQRFAAVATAGRDVEMLRTVGDSRVHGDSNPLILAFRAVYEAGRGSRTDPPLL